MKKLVYILLLLPLLGFGQDYGYLVKTKIIGIRHANFGDLNIGSTAGYVGDISYQATASTISKEYYDFFSIPNGFETVTTAVHNYAEDFNTSYPCTYTEGFTRTKANFNFPFTFSGCSFRQTLYPLHITEPTLSNDKLCLTDEITLELGYEWQYSYDGSAWVDFPSNLNTPVTTFVLSDLLGQTTENQVKFRTGYNSNYTNVVTYHIISCSPKITDFITTQPKCSTSSDGGFQMLLKPNLPTGKKLVASLFFLSDSTTIPNKYSLYAQDSTNVLVDNGNDTYTYNWPLSKAIPSGTYKVRYQTIDTTAPNPTWDSLEGTEDGFTIESPKPVIFSATNSKNVSCYGGSDGQINITASGGTGTYQYQLDGGTLTSFTNETIPTISGLSAGKHNIKVRDGNNCIGHTAANNESVDVTIGQPSTALTISQVIPLDPLKHNSKDGSIQFDLTGGTIDYTPVLKNGTTVVPTTVTKTVTNTVHHFVLSGIGAGFYTLEATDANGCVIIPQSISLNNPALLEVSINQKQAIACYGEKGALEANPNGGPSGTDYTYQWYAVIGGVDTELASKTSKILENIPAGIYKVAVTDDNKITQLSASFPLSQPLAPLTISTTTTDISCYGGNNGAIVTTVTGGTAPYTYKWNDLTTTGTKDRAMLQAGTYNLIVTDDHGCTTTAEIIFKNPPIDPLSITTNNIQPLTVPGDSTGAIATTAQGGTAPYTYSWIKDTDVTVYSTDKDITNLTKGRYALTAKDKNGCTVTSTFDLIDPQLLEVTIQEQAITCYNASNGALTATGAGGTPFASEPYTYEWFKETGGVYATIGQKNRTATGLSAGTYKVIIKDFYDITAQSILTISEPAPLVVIYTQANVLCKAAANGELKIVASGGTPPYTYALTDSNGLTKGNTSTVNGLAGGSYTLQVTDHNNCENVKTIVITEPANALTITINGQTNPSAYLATDGQATAIAQGGTAPYNYQWKDTLGKIVGSTATVTGIGDGQYTLTVTDANYNLTTINTSCTASTTIKLIAPPLLTVAIGIENTISCFNNNDGILKATGNGGIPPYTYSWFIKDGSNSYTPMTFTQPRITNVAAGTYIVQITDANSITRSSEELLLAAPTKLQIETVNTTDALCYNTATGGISINVTGGTLPYTYAWSNNKLTANNTDISAGFYNITVTDAHLCQVVLNNIEVKQPLAPLSIATVDNKMLSGFETADGSVSVIATGGTSPYTYQWTKTGSDVVIATSNRAQGLDAGSYQLTILDKNSCSFVQNFLVEQPEKLQLTIEQTAFNLCYNDTNGILHANVTGGVKPYQYNWYAIANPTLNLGSELDLKDREAGTYGLTITDANNIKGTSQLTIIQPTPLKVVPTITNVLCYGAQTGSITLAVSGGSGDYTYSWGPQKTTSFLNNLYKGTYTVTVTDKNNCSSTNSYVIDEPAQPLQISNYTLTKPLGYGLSNGSITVTPIGGSNQYNYAWYDSSNSALTQTTATVVGIPAGTYKLILTDTNNCTVEQLFIVDEIPEIQLTITETPIACNGGNGTLTANATGGYLAPAAQYDYKWYNSAGVKMESIASFTRQAGSYYLIVTDSNGISKRKDFTLSEPPLLQITNATLTNVLCYGERTGGIELTVSGGTGNYTYSWSNSINTPNITALSAGIYTVTITDENSCTIKQSYTITEPPIYDFTAISLVRPSGTQSDGTITIKIKGGVAPYSYKWTNDNGLIVAQETATSSTTNIANNLPAGIYTIAVTDALGCILKNTYNLANPGELIANIVLKNPVSCYGNSNAQIEAITVGGVGGNVYTWYNAITNTKIGTNNVLLTNVAPGSYYLIVNNADGISEKSETLIVTQPQAVAVTYIMNNVSCFEKNDGAITLTATGGTSTYEYRMKIDNNPYGAWTSFLTTNTTTFTNLPKGRYQIQVRDGNQCSYNENNSLKTIVIDITQPSVLTIVSNTTTQTTGFGLSNGSVILAINGGTVPYSYLWLDANGVKQNATTSSLTNVPAGVYTVVITDVQNCTVTSTYTVNQPPVLAVTVTTQNNILCYNDKNGSLRATATGGVPFTSTAPYTYAWYKEGEANSIGNQINLDLVSAGSYFVIVTDKNGNTTQSVTYQLLQPQQLTATLNGSYTYCGTANDWTITTNAQGGTSPYKYSWNTGDTTPNLTNVKPGNYLVFITDINGCKIMQTYNVVLPKVLDVTATITQLNCTDACNAKIDLALTGGVAPYSINWNTGKNTASIDNLCPGIYTATVKDQKGCEVQVRYEITNPSPIVVNLGSNKTLCNNQFQNLDITIPDAAATYQWTSTNGFISSTPKVTLTDAGVYTAKVTNSQGCTGTGSIEIFKTNAGINSQFLLTSQAFANEEIILVNTSNPISATVEWILPRGAEIVKKTNETITIKFVQAGAYQVTLRSFLGECQQDYTKPIIVEEARLLPDIGDATTPFIIDFVPHPNPTTGAFTVDIKLQEPAAISLRLYSLNSGQPINDKQVNNANVYSVDYNVNLPAGIYFLLLETPKGNEIRKIIIK
ncbi:T9SS type A sorting domain-containing protein [Flavobacterium muglaense]|uniref:T9SS type A sorting domain-containing protein n=1 Tax=Flavobacterium muglaense TaxID=2764716 RepID=A0A923MZ29_9FLAO|nr:T9SS type A sorting domain-containing protein [Flavobacterium muglaense]MBC5837501.1 T9SS type A sorting domain-containing protein [Flavobacterium muglaense]MBC5844082.1 T9SS type A sorting domain-containing protein [Flavobacterium muglaense]